MRKYGFKNGVNPTIEQIREILNPQLKKQLLEIQSGVTAYGLNEQLKENKEYGILHLKEFMKSIIPKEQTPDFSYIGLSNYELLQYSNQFGNYSMQNENNISVREK